MLDDLKAALRGLCNAQVRLWVGMAFVALAMMSIQYDENIAPGVGRISDAWNSAATDLGRTLASFTL